MQETIITLSKEMYHFVLFLDWEQWNDDLDNNWNGDKGYPVRLRKFEGNLYLQYGDPGWDADHRGFWADTHIEELMTLEECREAIKQMFEEINFQEEELLMIEEIDD